VKLNLVADDRDGVSWRSDTETVTEAPVTIRPPRRIDALATTLISVAAESCATTARIRIATGPTP